MNKKILVIFSLLFLLLMITNVSAIDFNTTDDKVISAVDSVQDIEVKYNSADNGLLSEDNNSDEKILLKSTDEDILHEDDDTGSLADLNKLVKTTPKELILNKNYIVGSKDSCLEITKNNYIIDFNGYTLDANSTSARTVIKVTGKNVTIKNMKFINGIGTYTFAGPYLNGLTGSIDWDGDNGILDNITLSNSLYAIGWHGKYGVMNNSIIEQCVNTVVIFTGENFVLNNSIIRDNIHSRDDRPLVILNSYSTAYNCTFNNPNGNQMIGLGANSGQFNCKVLYCNFYYGREAVTPMAVASSIEYCTFTRVSSDSGRAVIYLAGVSVNTVIDNCNFIDCNPTEGGVVGYNNNNIFTLSNSRFINNSAISLSNGYIISSCIVENSTFSSNLYASTGTISDCNFTNNQFTSTTNNHVILSGNTIVKNCNFINNTGCTKGIILLDNDNYLLRVYDSNFVTKSEYNGWAITASISNSKFYERGNTYNNKTRAAISAISPDSTLLDELWVTSRDVSGGTGTRTNPFNLVYGINIVDYGGTVNFLNDGIYRITSTLTISKPITINGNGATITNPNGLAIQLDGGAVNSVINYLVFKDCGQTTREEYGAIFNNAHCVLIANSTFINNAGSNTGAIRLSTGGTGRLSTIDNCTFKNNVGYYGAVTVGASVCTVSNSRFEDNIGTYVGGIYVWNANDNNIRNLGFTLTNCNFTRNKADSTVIKNDYYGVYPVGAVSISSTNSEVTGCRFENNSAIYIGALCMNKAEKVIDCVFINNAATQYAGGVYMDSNDAAIIHCSFINNKQTGTDNQDYGGGAIYVTGNNLNIENSIFESNIAQYGSAIWTKNGLSYSLTITNSNFTKHTSTVVDLNNYSATITHCNFLNNTAQVIQCIGTSSSQNLIVTNSNFKFNNINTGNGVAINSMVLTNIEECIFINNTATTGIVSLNYDESNVLKSSFINNTANWASAIRVNANNIKIKSSNFTDNSANSNDLSGAVYINGDYTLITESNFTGNKGNIRGAAVYITRSSGEKYYYYIDSFTTATCGNIAGQNDIYSTYGQKLMNEVYVILNPDGVSGSDKSGVDERTPTNFEIAFNRVAPDGSIIFVNSSETYNSFTIEISEHNKGDSYNGTIFVCEKYGVKFYGKNTTFVNLRFSINSKSYGVEFNNITFTGYNNSTIIWNSENGVINNCIFKDNPGDKCIKGGAIQALGNNLTVKNSLFTNNAVKSDNDPIGGGAIYCNVVALNIINSNFTSNIADNGAHILIDEYAGDNNGEIVSIINSSFKNGMKYTIGGSSIILNRGDVSIINCTFTSNIIDSNGGAIYVAQFAQNLEFKNNSFINNEAINGGAIAFNNADYKQITIINNNFTGNKATNQGGAIAFTTNNIIDLIMADNYFKYNNATNNGGAIYSNTKLSEDNSLYTGNSANYGGAIYLDSNAFSTSIVYCNFTNNTGSGSAINIKSGDVNINHCIFTKNNGSNYGAIDTSQGADGLTIKNSEFYNNTASVDAGAICFASKANNMLGYNLTFEGNSATNGGACRISGFNNTIENSTFKNNIASNMGGAIFAYIGKSILTFKDCEFIGNNATYGGALYISSQAPNTIVFNCNFTNNTATINGGAIYIDANNITVSGCNFKYNKAINGSAIFIVNDKFGFELKNSNFNDNNATEHGTVHLTGVTDLKLTNNIFDNNNPVGIIENYYILDINNYKSSMVYVDLIGGGTGLSEDNPTSMDNAWSIADNNAKIIFLSGEYELSKTISNMNYTFVGRNGVILKRTSLSKSILILENGANVTIENITMDAGIEVSDGELNLNNITFTSTNNQAGGIVYASGTMGCIKNSYFIDSTYLSDNHIITVNGNVSISNSEFKNNAINGSVVYYGSAGSGNIQDSIFSDNKASNLRNINISNINHVNVYNNTLDVNVTYTITNSTYGSSAYVNGTFDAGVNFELSNVKLIINDTCGTKEIVIIGADKSFTFNISGKLNVGKYNLTVTSNDDNKYNINYLSDNFQVTKASITINTINDITVGYGDNDTITITGYITNNMNYGNNYTGNVSVIIADNKPVNTTVNKNGTFTVNLTIKDFNNGIYALNITIEGSDNFNGSTRKFDTYLTVHNATITITNIDKIIVEYGADYIIVNGTLNSTKFGTNYTGSITVKINELSNKTEVVNQTFSVKITNSTPFKVGKYNIVADGEAISNYNAIATYTLTEGFEVLSIVPDFTISSPSIGYGENATVYITLPDDASGKLVINVSNGENKIINIF